MQFTYEAYQNLLSTLNACGYEVASYYTWQDKPRCVILRHDVDNSLPQALKMAELEASLGVCSTYYILLRTDFYNAASASSQAVIQRIHALGHEIGLHFDEVFYSDGMPSKSELVRAITQEADYLSQLCGFPIRTVSMHRPSKATLDADLKIPGIINSYGTTFFHNFKYLSDSRRRWREPVLDIIRSGEYDRLHILTHAFWYHEKEESISEAVRNFVNDGNMIRYAAMRENITDLPSIMQESEVR